jgi:CubicO group peptidase (beta-lactamase class C family)
MNDLTADVARIAAESEFSGVVRIDEGGETVLAEAFGLADRRCGIPNTMDTRFATASAVKGMTAMTIVNLIDQGALSLATTARSILGGDLPLIDDRVTVEQLLRHRSGIGDYADEDAGYELTDYILKVPVHTLTHAEAYVPALDGFPMKSEPGEKFVYNNGGFAVLALLAERAAGVPFAELLDRFVLTPARMPSTAFIRSDELPPGTATGYFEATGLRTNVLHLPILGTGDGGLYTTAADVAALWRAFFAGRIVSEQWVAEMTRLPEPTAEYGLGIWLAPGKPFPRLVGSDAGVSFCSIHDPQRNLTVTVISNWTDGAWPLARHLRLALEE